MLEGIKENINKLISLYENEKTERKKLQDSLAKSEVENEAFRKQIKELEDQIANLKLTRAFQASSGNNSDAKAKIDKLIREIDRCISLIGE